MTLNIDSTCDAQVIPPVSEGFPAKMALVDIETTGGKAIKDAITEIAVILIDDGKVTGSWQTLLNPGTPIPPFITRLTGISNGMVQTAPIFEDKADELFAVLEGRVFVAHNARFDYGFIKQAFKRHGYSYATQPLCSVKLSRSLFPGHKGHSLDAIIKRFNLALPSRHRAYGDCLAIAKFFSAATQLLDDADIQAACDEALKQAALPTQLTKSCVDKIPNTPGVYYFYDASGGLLYIGKSVTLKKRVLSHFYQDHQNPKDLEMSKLIADVQYRCTPSDFSAQLLESEEIKRLSPPFNRRLKKLTKLYQYRIESNDLGYHCVSIKAFMPTSDADPTDCGLFRSKKKAEERLAKLADQHYLCHQFLGLEPETGRACFRSQLKRCFGPCDQREPAAIYNERLAIALKNYRTRAWPFNSAIVIQEKPQAIGKNSAGYEDNAVHYHLINEWRYIAKITHQAELYDWGYQLAEEGAGKNSQLSAASLSEKAQHTASDHDSAQDNIDMAHFDLDTYKILMRFILNKSQQVRCGLTIMPCVSI